MNALRWDESPTSDEARKQAEFLTTAGVPGHIRSQIARASTRRERAGILRAFLREAPKAQ